MNPDDFESRQVPWARVWEGERALIEKRRTALGIEAVAREPAQTVGLALSGGGVRSATFALGVMQSLARLRLLECVDYLSTASGGGYIGAFFASLFARPPGGKDAATRAYDVMRGACDKPQPAPAAPPPRAAPARGAAEGARGWQLWWLRNSGRYLVPSGAGDYLYAVALALRNLVAIHYVLGTGIVLAAVPTIAFDQMVREVLGHALAMQGSGAMEAAGGALASRGAGLAAVAAALLLLWAIPVGLAYFASEIPDQTVKLRARLWWFTSTLGVFFATGMVSVIAAVVWSGFKPASRWPLAGLLGAAGLVIALSVLCLVAAAESVQRGKYTPGFRDDMIVPPQAKMLTTRVALTKWLATALKVVLLIFGAAMLLFVSYTVFDEPRALLAKVLAWASGGGAILMAIVKQTEGLLAPRRSGKATRHSLPLDAIALVLGLALAVLLLLLWHVVTWVALDMLNGSSLRPGIPWPPLLELFAAVLFLSIVTGRRFGFANLTTLQNLYASRLTRAYLGASNPARSDIADPRWTHISDNHPDDNLSLDRYYEASNRAPLHIINMTLNETVSPVDPLVQRDRHGRPMALSPGHLCVDGHFWDRPSTAAADAADRTRSGEQCAPENMALGSWIGISGAAFSTGAGRGTTLGKSLLFALSNVRLGYWWRAGWMSAPSQSRADLALRGLTYLFQTQSYLLAELLGRYRGRFAPYWYLSDGGHFENTALYELLRRRVGLVICVDAGADPAYSQDDVGNMMRLARIDFGCEFTRLDAAAVRANTDVPKAMGDLIWQPDPPDEPSRGRFEDDQCLNLYWVQRRADAADGSQGTALLVIKPRLPGNAPVDVRQYAQSFADFPQQTTADQFFDEQQWESYRKLGELIGACLAIAPEGAALQKVHADLQALRGTIRNLASDRSRAGRAAEGARPCRQGI